MWTREHAHRSSSRAWTLLPSHTNHTPTPLQTPNHHIFTPLRKPWGSNNFLRHNVVTSNKTINNTTEDKSLEKPAPQHSTTQGKKSTTNLGADVILGRGLREALYVHGVLRHGWHAAPAPLAPLLAVLAAVLSSLSAASCAAPPVAGAASAAVGLAAVLVALAGGADAGDRCPLLKLKLWVWGGWWRVRGRVRSEERREMEQHCCARVFCCELLRGSGIDLKRRPERHGRCQTWADECWLKPMLPSLCQYFIIRQHTQTHTTRACAETTSGR